MLRRPTTVGAGGVRGATVGVGVGGVRGATVGVGAGGVRGGATATVGVGRVRGATVGVGAGGIPGLTATVGAGGVRGVTVGAGHARGARLGLPPPLSVSTEPFQAPASAGAFVSNFGDNILLCAVECLARIAIDLDRHCQLPALLYENRNE